METLHEAPKPSSFVSLLEHQSSTPASFYTGPPVLHYYSDRSKLVVLEHEVQSIPALAPLLASSTSHPDPQLQDSNTNGASEPHVAGAQKVIENLDVFVTSEKLVLYSPTANAGLSIPYPSISLHAIQTLPSPSPGDQQGLYMQVVSQPPSATDDEEPESISLTVIPTACAPPQVASTATGTTESGLEGEDEKEQTPVLAMFNALSACSNLHPDPVEPGDSEGDEGEDAAGSRLFRAGLAFPGAQDGGLPPALPGSGGWITAENMHEFFDEEGNWIGEDDQEEGDEERDGNGGGDASARLGPGAGTVRPRQDAQQGNGDAADGENDETKWRRTS